MFTPKICTLKNTNTLKVCHNDYSDNMQRLEFNTCKVHDNGYVQLIDILPRITPNGVLPESAIARSARVSTSMGERSLREDSNLISRLAKDKHTSPFESAKCVFLVRTTVEVARQFERHRMQNINEFSMRYKKLLREDDPKNMCPVWGRKLVFSRRSNMENGIRMQGSDKNKQQSDESVFITDEIIDIVKQQEALAIQQYELYYKLCELGVSREVARSYLPLATYTEIQTIFDLNNLLKFFYLRSDRKHAQVEIADVSDAMKMLIAPLFPTVMKHYELTKP